MALVPTLVCVLAVQQLQVQPFPVVAGAPAVARVHRDGVPVAEAAIEVRDAGGALVVRGSTDPRGELAFTVMAPGDHVVAALSGGVRAVVPVPVVAARARWPLALGAVPLGVALLWWNLSRARGRRTP